MERLSLKFHARVLVVEDYIVNQELIKELLEMMNCTVDTAEDGKQALVMYRAHPYDLILMDIQMPEMDGCEVTKIIREEEKEQKHTPIVALTANALQGDREKYLAVGMDDYLSKPIRAKDLETTLKKFLKS